MNTDVKFIVDAVVDLLNKEQNVQECDANEVQ
jgi:hypothetical protein